MSDYEQGEVKDVTPYDRALTANEIARLHVDPHALWRNRDRVVDTSGHGNHGTFINPDENGGE